MTEETEVIQNTMYQDDETVLKNYTLFLLNFFKEKDTRSVSEWVCDNIQFNEPGNSRNFTLRGREYIREPLDLISSRKNKDIVLVFGSQSGKTAMLMGGAAYLASNTSNTIFWAMPNQELAERFSETRWIPMLRNSSTANLLPSDTRKTKKALQFVGSSTVIFVGSNSPAQLASQPARIIILDEVDKFSRGTNLEGDAVNLAEQRAKDMPYPKRIKTSTPTIESNLIWQEFLKGDQRRYFMPCPFCGEDVVFVWSKEFSVLPKLGREAYIYWDESAKSGDQWDYDKVGNTAYALCPFCKGHITENFKTKMIRSGHWVATNTKSDKTFASFHLSSLYSTSPENSFGNIAIRFLKNLKSTFGLQGIVNGDFAEPWVSQEVQNRTELVLSSTYSWENEKTVKILTADFQKNAPHIWYIVREWKGNGDSKLRDFGSCDTFEELEAIQAKHEIKDGAVAVDSGFDSQTIYQICADHGRFIRAPGRIPQHLGWIPTKGCATSRYWLDKKTGQKMVYGFGKANLGHRQYSLDILEYNSDMIKDVLWRMRLQKTEEKWAVTDIVNDEYWKHLSAESKIERIQSGRRVWVWELRNKAVPNHLLDCEVVQLAMAMLFQFLDPKHPFDARSFDGRRIQQQPE